MFVTNNQISLRAEVPMRWIFELFGVLLQYFIGLLSDFNKIRIIETRMTFYEEI